MSATLTPPLAVLPPGRAFDLAALRGQQDTPAPQLLDQDLLAGGGAAVTGIVKLCQWAVATLLTPVGSRPYSKAVGTTLYGRLVAGTLRTETDVAVAFAFAAGDVLAQAKAIQTTATPADETLTGLDLAGVVLTPGSAALSIAVTTAAGATRRVLLPLS
jgi:hypothetical protein